MVYFSTCRARGDRRRRDLRYASMHSSRDAQLSSLVDAYLLWKHPLATASEESQARVEHDFHVTRVGVFGMLYFFLSHVTI